MSDQTETIEAVIVFPVRNEATVLAKTVRETATLAARLFSDSWRIVIAENGSTDNTWQIAEELVETIPQIVALKTTARGKGGAIRQGWQLQNARYYFFSDADVSADLNQALPALYKQLQQGGDMVVGSRAIKGVEAKRPLVRKVFSCGYRLLARVIVGTRLTDLPCGLKAISHKLIEKVLPEVKDNTWFFDSELLLLVEAKGYRIKEVPVSWVEYRYTDRPQRIPLFRTAWLYVRALVDVRRRLLQVRATKEKSS